MKKIIHISFSFLLLTLGGCAHQIQLNPDMTRLQESANKSDKVVGYHISVEDFNRKVTTPGGGGDKVTYTPYKDTESALYTVLSNKFKDVYSVKSLDDKSFIKDNEIALVFVPRIITNSSSDSFVTWPPTKFMLELSCKAINANGETVWEKQIATEGQAEFDEFKSDFSLSARRATEKAFLQLALALENEKF